MVRGVKRKGQTYCSKGSTDCISTFCPLLSYRGWCGGFDPLLDPIFFPGRTDVLSQLRIDEPFCSAGCSRRPQRRRRQDLIEGHVRRRFRQQLIPTQFLMVFRNSLHQFLTKPKPFIRVSSRFHRGATLKSTKCFLFYCFTW